ncbi:MAG: hypothetical protein H6727_20090 [Myxococcales bacterium]|nr:hypothetical protein [Myxococcales bacterium]
MIWHWFSSRNWLWLYAICLGGWLVGCGPVAGGDDQLKVIDQTSDGRKITVAEAVLSQDGFVVLAWKADGKDEIAASSWLKAGKHTDISIQLKAALDLASPIEMVGTIFHDANKNGSLDNSDAKVDSAAATAKFTVRAPDAGAGELIVADQTLASGTKVIIQKAVVPEDVSNARVAIYADDAGKPGSFLGSASLRRGTHEDVELSLQKPQDTTQTLHAILHDVSKGWSTTKPMDSPILKDKDGKDLHVTFVATALPRNDALTISSQKTDGASVLASSASLTKAGWIVIAKADGSEIYGDTLLQPGAYADVSISLSPALTQKTNLQAYLVHDEDGDGTRTDADKKVSSIVRFFTLDVAGPDAAELLVQDQTPADGSKIAIARVVVPDAVSNSRVAFYTDNAGKPDRYLGSMAFQKGTYTDEVVTLNESLVASQTLYAVLHDISKGWNTSKPFDSPILQGKDGKDLQISFKVTATPRLDALSIASQKTDGTSVLATSATLSKAGWIVIAKADDSVIFGDILLQPGVHQDVSIPLMPAITADTSLLAYIVHDANGDGMRTEADQRVRTIARYFNLTVAGPANAVLEVNDQAPAFGRHITLTKVSVPDALLNSRVAIYTDNTGKPGRYLGSMAFRKGVYTNVIVVLNETLETDQALYAVLHDASKGWSPYDPFASPVVQEGGKDVSLSFNITASPSRDALQVSSQTSDGESVLVAVATLSKPGWVAIRKFGETDVLGVAPLGPGFHQDVTVTLGTALTKKTSLQAYLIHDDGDGLLNSADTSVRNIQSNFTLDIAGPSAAELGIADQTPPFGREITVAKISVPGTVSDARVAFYTDDAGKPGRYLGSMAFRKGIYTNVVIGLNETLESSQMLHAAMHDVSQGWNIYKPLDSPMVTEAGQAVLVSFQITATPSRDDLKVESQKGDGTGIFVNGVTLSKAGWVAIRKLSGTSPLGTLLLPAGRHYSVRVPFSTPLTQSTSLEGYLIHDNGDGRLTASDKQVPSLLRNFTFQPNGPPEGALQVADQTLAFGTRIVMTQVIVPDGVSIARAAVYADNGGSPGTYLGSGAYRTGYHQQSILTLNSALSSSATPHLLHVVLRDASSGWSPTNPAASPVIKDKGGKDIAITFRATVDPSRDALQVDSQKNDGKQVQVTKATLTKSGWVVIRQRSNSTILGSKVFLPGSYNNVSVSLSVPVTETSALEAYVVHDDGDGQLTAQDTRVPNVFAFFTLTLQGPANAALSVQAQTLAEARTVILSQVAVPDGVSRGIVAIYSDNGGSPGAYLGSLSLRTGSYTNVSLGLNATLLASQFLHAVLHDADGWSITNPLAAPILQDAQGKPLDILFGATALPQASRLFVDSQKNDGKGILIRSATMAQRGWVVIREQSATNDTILAAHLLEIGTYQDLSVALQPGLTKTTNLEAYLVEDDGDGVLTPQDRRATGTLNILTLTIAGPEEGSLRVGDQTLAFGTRIVMTQVIVPDGVSIARAAVYADNGGSPGAYLGSGAYRTGYHQQSILTLNSALSSSATPHLLHVVLRDASSGWSPTNPAASPVIKDKGGKDIAITFRATVDPSRDALKVDSQKNDGKIVTINKVVLTKPGWVVIETQTGGSLLGTKVFQPGSYDNIAMTLTAPVTKMISLKASLVHDDGDGRYTALDKKVAGIFDVFTLTLAGPPVAALVVNAQTLVRGRALTLAQVAVPDGVLRGVVAIYKDNNGALGDYLGSASFRTGSYQNMTLTLNDTQETTQSLRAVLHDADGGWNPLQPSQSPILQGASGALSLTFVATSQPQSDELSILSQKTDGQTLSVARATLSQEGFVVVYRDVSGQKDVYGTLLLPAGFHEGLVLSLQKKVTATTQLSARIFHDDGDGRYTSSDTAVTSPSALSLFTATLLGPAVADLVVADQFLADGRTIQLQSVVVPEQGGRGRVAIYSDNGGQPDAYLGSASFGKGSHPEVSVRLNQLIQSSQTLHVILHDISDGWSLASPLQTKIFKGSDGKELKRTIQITANPQQNLLRIASQKTDGRSIAIREVVMSRAGWLVLHQGTSTSGTVLVAYALQPGFYHDFSVALTKPLAATSQIFGTLYLDDGDQIFSSSDTKASGQSTALLTATLLGPTFADLEALDQSMEDGRTLVVQRVVVPEGKLRGSVAVYLDNSGQPGTFLGRTSVQKGVHLQVQVSLNQAFETSRKVHVLLHDASGTWNYSDPLQVPLLKDKDGKDLARTVQVAATPQRNLVQIYSQTTDGTNIAVRQAVTSRAGWLVVYANKNGTKTVHGTMLLQPAIHENLTMTLSVPLTQDTRLSAIIAHDDGDGVYGAQDVRAPGSSVILFEAKMQGALVASLVVRDQVLDDNKTISIERAVVPGSKPGGSIAAYTDKNGQPDTYLGRVYVAQGAHLQKTIESSQLLEGKQTLHLLFHDGWNSTDPLQTPVFKDQAGNDIKTTIQIDTRASLSYIVANDQVTDQPGELWIERGYSFEKTAWIVIARDNNGQPGEVLGKHWVNYKQTQRQKVSLDRVGDLYKDYLKGTGIRRAIRGDETVHVMLYQDEPSDQMFTYKAGGTEDLPVLDKDGRPIRTTMRVRVEGTIHNFQKDSLYYYDHCSSISQWRSAPTSLMVDCRCHMALLGGFPICWSPALANGNGYTFGSGPRWATLSTRILQSGFVEPQSKELIGILRWKSPELGRDVGVVVGIHYETGARRLISGTFDNAAQGVHQIGSGPTMYRPYDIRRGPDGMYYVYGWGQPIGSKEVIKVDPSSGNRTLVWRSDDPSFGQCASGRGTTTADRESMVDIRMSGFEVGPSGNIYISFSNGASLGGEGQGIVKISKDGKHCSFVTRSNAHPNNAYYYGQPVGTGPQPQDGAYTGMAYRNGALYAGNSLEGKVFKIDIATGNRTLVYDKDANSGLAASTMRRLVFDPHRPELLWVSGIANQILYFDPSKGQGYRLHCYDLQPQYKTIRCQDTGPLIPGAEAEGGFWFHPTNPDFMFVSVDGFAVLKVDLKNGTSRSLSF